MTFCNLNYPSHKKAKLFDILLIMTHKDYLSKTYFAVIAIISIKKLLSLLMSDEAANYLL